MARLGLRIAPDRSALWGNLASNESNQGHFENSIAAYRKLIEALPKDRTLSPEWRDVSVPRATLAALLSDFPEALRQHQRSANVPNVVLSGAVQLDVFEARALARMHDASAAAASLSHPRFALSWQVTENQYQLLQAGITNAALAEDWPGVVALAPAYLALPARYVDRGHNNIVANIGLARAATGDARGAAEILNILAPDSDYAMIAKGRALLALGDTASAERLFALVAARAPSVAYGPLFQGRWRVEHGQPAAALPFLAEAKRRAPHWADPLKYEGDAFAALGRWSQAEAAYAKAEPFARSGARCI